jgi:GAF domain-containing protein
LSKKEDTQTGPPPFELPILTQENHTSVNVDPLFSEDSLSIIMAKTSALEAFLNAVTRDSKFNEFTREILITILNVVKSEAGSILEVDQENQSLFFRSVVGSSSHRVVNFVIPFGQGIVGYVAESRLPLVVDNVPENKVHLKSIENAVGFEARNLVAVPILIRGRLYGVLELLNRIGEPNYSSADLELLTYLCEMAAKSIEARLMIAWSYEANRAHKKDGAI